MDEETYEEIWKCLARWLEIRPTDLPNYHLIHCCKPLHVKELLQDIRKLVVKPSEDMKV